MEDTHTSQIESGKNFKIYGFEAINCNLFKTLNR